MNKNRLENFSDGVFAIAVTLLILNVKIPDISKMDNSHLDHVLIDMMPHLATFAFSFLVIGVFWIAHHRIFSFVEIPNSTILWLNIVYLMFVAMIPVPASILSENPFLPTAILFYTISLLIIAIMHFIILEYILRNRDLKHEVLTGDVYKATLRNATVGPVCYVIAAVGSFFSVYISFFFIVASMIFYIFFAGRGKLDAKMVETAKAENRRDDER